MGPQQGARLERKPFGCQRMCRRVLRPGVAGRRHVNGAAGETQGEFGLAILVESKGMQAKGAAVAVVYGCSHA